MKANAPEKIYIFENPILDFTKLSVRQSDTDIEYTRTDAFIKKACEFLNKVTQGYVIREFLTGENYAGKIVEDFRKYMEE